MPEQELRIQCQRCGAQMEMKDPAPGDPWKPDQFWVCPSCGRHFWSTYPNPPGTPAKPAAPAPKPAPAEAPKPATQSPAAEAAAGKSTPEQAAASKAGA